MCLNEGIIAGIQLHLHGGKHFIRTALRLQIEDMVECILQGDHGSDAFDCIFRLRRRPVFHRITDALIDLAADDGKAPFLDVVICFDLFCFKKLFRPFASCEDLSRQILRRLCDRSAELPPVGLDGDVHPAVKSGLKCERSEDHLGMLHKVGVEPYPVCIFGKADPAFARKILQLFFPLAEEENICNGFRSGC